MTTASIFSDFWNRLADHDQQGLFLVLIGFILSFAFIPMSTRLMRSPRLPWWPGSIVSEGGVHLHHLVFGIVTMMIAGARFRPDRRTERFKNAFRDIVGGKPSKGLKELERR